MSDAAVATADEATTQDEKGPHTNAILPPGQTATVFAGEQPATFRVSLTGTIQRTAQMAVAIDNATAAVLSFDIRNTTVNGRRITVTNQDREPQGFVASLIS